VLPSWIISLDRIEADRILQAFDVLPDEDVWSGHYNQINFPERPTDKESKKVRSRRLWISSATMGRLTQHLLGQITNEQLLASIFRPRADPIKGFQSYAPLEEDLPQWHKVRHHVLPADEDRDYTNVEWDVRPKCPRPLNPL
jgi:hypothetical protein